MMCHGCDPYDNFKKSRHILLLFVCDHVAFGQGFWSVTIIFELEIHKYGLENPCGMSEDT